MLHLPSDRAVPKWGLLLLLAGAALAGHSGSAEGAPIALERPGQHEFIRDLAGLINGRDQQAIRKTCAALLRDRATPIIVVTIESMAKYGCPGMRIETFARLLFDQWGIGQARLEGQPWNTGILFLVSKADRKARVELGAGWSHEKDALCQRILHEQVIPLFRASDFSGGILAGVESLDRMARGLKLPDVPVPWWVYPAVSAALAVVFMSIVSLVFQGHSGWGWVFWSVTLGILAYLLTQLLTSRSSGGYSGGSFGGGFSDGGGATDSW